jgi:hypothetical protein
MNPKDDKAYFSDLNKLVDHLYKVATDQQWTYTKLAQESGLTKKTIDNLGSRKTQFPQYRTVQNIAVALGGRVDFIKGKFSWRGAKGRLKIWKLKREPRKRKLRAA